MALATGRPGQLLKRRQPSTGPWLAFFYPAPLSSTIRELTVPGPVEGGHHSAAPNVGLIDPCGSDCHLVSSVSNAQLGLL